MLRTPGAGTQSVPDFVKLLRSSDAVVAEAAARALGRIGGTDAVRALEAARGRATPRQLRDEIARLGVQLDDETKGKLRDSLARASSDPQKLLSLLERLRSKVQSDNGPNSKGKSK